MDQQTSEHAQGARGLNPARGNDEDGRCGGDTSLSRITGLGKLKGRIYLKFMRKVKQKLAIFLIVRIKLLEIVSNKIFNVFFGLY